MNFNDFWDEAVRQNPALRDQPAIIIDVDKFRRAIRDAFEAGRMAGDDAGFERGLRSAATNVTEAAMATKFGRRH